MTWVLTEKEIQQVLEADGPHRYEYFVHRVCEAKAVWALANDGWASVKGDENETLIPLWPHRAYAEAFATGSWSAFSPTKIALDDFLAQWIRGMRQIAAKPAVFPVPHGSAVVVDLEELETSLRHELEEVYGVGD